MVIKACQMKIAIHHRPGSFSEPWIKYCEEKKIPFKIVCCYDNDIISQLHDCEALMWHHHHAILKDVLISKQLLFSLQQSGKKVFPDFNTNWHFDDKLGQKYLLESINAPLVPSHIFFDKFHANKWIDSTTFPKVFKLRGGAGAVNVELVTTEIHARKIVDIAFGKGFLHYDRWKILKEKIGKMRLGQSNFADVIKGTARFVIPTEYYQMREHDKGYVYFQDFIANNDCDIRVIVIGDRAFAIKRLVRENDFRASGSGKIEYERNNFDDQTIRLAFQVSKKLNIQVCAFDFVFDHDSNPLIVEISFGFSMSGYFNCVGYWDSTLNFFSGPFNPYGWMVDLVWREQHK